MSRWQATRPSASESSGRTDGTATRRAPFGWSRVVNRDLGRLAGVQALVLVIIAALMVGCAPQASPVQGQLVAQKPANRDLILATTTSTQDSGLLDVLVPMFEQKSGYKVRTIAVGTGQALAMAERGVADVLLVHAPEAERKVVESGAAVNRTLVMHNDFVIVGPADDSARVRGTAATTDALKNIAASQTLFVSRGDGSGTHQMERALWQSAGIDPAGRWYQESGSGMGQTLNIAAERKGYALTDRATYLALKKNLTLDIVVEGDARLLNIYHAMQANPARFGKVNADGGKAFVDFLVSPEAQAAIETFGVVKYGQALFVPDAGKSEQQLLATK
jgi:tungstate transport system substrate-binding protein